MQAPLLAKKMNTLLSFNYEQKSLFNEWKTGALGDLGKYTELAMKPWNGTFSSKHTISIDRIDRLLVQLAARFRFSDEAIRKQRDVCFETDKELRNIIVRLESWEAKWLVRLILRDYCTIELNEKHFFENYHFLLPDLLMFQNDFDAVCGMLKSELSCYPAAPCHSHLRNMRIEAAQKLKPVVGIKVGRPTFYKAWSFKHCFQMVAERPWAAEVKYDGEYCEIHIDLEKAGNEVKIFSKNGKDATQDRISLHSTIRKALRIGRTDCLFKSRCIVLGEMVLYSDKENKILPFSKIRKHVSRSGSFLGTMEDSLPHQWEHLMIVFFDILVLDDEPVLGHGLQDRRRILRELIHVIPGWSMRSEWTLVDFRTGDGMTDLKQVFARSLADRQEGLVLKPLHAPYFSLLTDHGQKQSRFFIKLKKDYLGDMGGERDLGDFAILGASLDPQVAFRADFKPLHWTHFYLGCCMNADAVRRTGARPKFKVVACLGGDKSIPKPDLKYLNIQGYVRQTPFRLDGSTAAYDTEGSKSDGRRMTVAFKEPFVAEVLGSGFEKNPNEKFEMLRHPRITKIHHDRTWTDTVSMDDLECMAKQKWDAPDANKLEGHAKEVASLAKRYVREMNGSQITSTSTELSQASSRQTTQQTTQETPREITSTTLQVTVQQNLGDDVVQETQQDTFSTVTTCQSSVSGSSQKKGTRASRDRSILIREDTSERLAHLAELPTAPLQLPTPISTAGTVVASATITHASIRRKRSTQDAISPPMIKRRKIFSPLKDASGNRHLGEVEFDSQEKVIHIYANEGLRVQVHKGLEED